MIPFRLAFALALCLAATATMAPRAAATEYVDRAVSLIAQRFVEARGPDEPVMRVAVTAFIQSDRRTTQLTNLLMIALTGKMVEYGRGRFSVIERAQLETALAEIQLSDVPIFDRDTARELGSFLGVDALIVGEITPQTDDVRIDARLIAVDTIETLEQAVARVPLTPTVQRQLDTQAILVRARIGDGDRDDRRNGIWRGVGRCGDSEFGLAVSIVVNADESLTAMQTYFPRRPRDNVQSGVLAMEGRIAPDGEFNLVPGSWLYQPSGHSALGFSGRLDADRGRLTANYDQEGCERLTLERMR